MITLATKRGCAMRNRGFKKSTRTCGKKLKKRRA